VRVAVSGGAGSPSNATATVERGGSMRAVLGGGGVDDGSLGAVRDVGYGAVGEGSVGVLRDVAYGEGAGRTDAVVVDGEAGVGVGIGTGLVVASGVVDDRSSGVRVERSGAVCPRLYRSAAVVRVPGGVRSGAVASVAERRVVAASGARSRVGSGASGRLTEAARATRSGGLSALGRSDDREPAGSPVRSAEADAAAGAGPASVVADGTTSPAEGDAAAEGDSAAGGIGAGASGAADGIPTGALGEGADGCAGGPDGIAAMKSAAADAVAELDDADGASEFGSLSLSDRFPAT